MQGKPLRKHNIQGPHLSTYDLYTPFQVRKFQQGYNISIKGGIKFYFYNQYNTQLNTTQK